MTRTFARPALGVLAAGLLLAGCTGGDDATTASSSASPSASANPSVTSLALTDAFCEDAALLYQRDSTVSEAISAVDPSTLTAEQLADPDVFDAYVDAIDIAGWESWRALYVQAAEDSNSAQMREWIDVIVTATDLQFAAYAEAAQTATTLTEWSQSVTELLADSEDLVEAEGNEALNASEASMAACGVPLSVPAGELLGYVG